jgi:hypothetical protein
METTDSYDSLGEKISEMEKNTNLHQVLSETSFSLNIEFLAKLILC